MAAVSDVLKTKQFNIRLTVSEEQKIEELAVALTAKTGKLQTRSSVVRWLIRNAKP